MRQQLGDHDPIGTYDSGFSCRCPLVPSPDFQVLSAIKHALQLVSDTCSGVRGMVGLSDAVAFFLRVLCSVLHLARFLQAAADLRCSAKPSC